MADVLGGPDGGPFIWYDGETWAAFYEEVAVKDRLPRILTDAQVACLGGEIARFHLACAEIAGDIPPPSKTAKSDAVNLHELLSGRGADTLFGLESSRLDLVRRHVHRYLMAVHESGYDDWPKMPVLIDWNLGNFSVEMDRDEFDAFTLFSRWDYDWFRIESRLLDFYFLSRVSSRTGDRSTFTYGSHTLLEPRFVHFLRAYHAVYPLTADEVLFLKEVYRFFLPQLCGARGAALLPVRVLAAPAPRRRRCPAPRPRRPRPEPPGRCAGLVADRIGRGPLSRNRSDRTDRSVSRSRRRARSRGR